MNPLLSIAIATKNREYYCIEAIKSILSIDSNILQLVIADNSDTNEIKKYVESINDYRLKYVYDDSPTSSIANFNRAVGLATGEYICMIGDDDGINPEILSAAKWASQNNIDALSGSYLAANYRWEGTGAPDTFFTKMTGGTLTITNFDCVSLRHNLEKSLYKLMVNGCTNYLEFNLPKLYHGIVKRQYLVSLKSETGDFLKGLSPDIYSSITLACKINNFVQIDYPLTIPGVCVSSTSISEGQLRTHSKRIEDIPHLRFRGNYEWSIQVPRVYCAQTIWADSGFAALREMNRLDLIGIFNKYKLYANIIYADKSTTSYVLDHLNIENKHNKYKVGLDCVKIIFAMLTGPYYMWFYKKRVIGRLKIIFKIDKYKLVNDLPNISFAMSELDKYISTRGINLLNHLNKTKLD